MDKRRQNIAVMIFIVATNLLMAQDWPMWAGPTGNWICDERETGIMRDFSKATLLWKSEEADIGPARSQSPRYTKGNLDKTPSSGWISPIVYGDYLYQHYWVADTSLYDPECYNVVSKNGEIALSAADSALARRHFAILCREYLLKIDIYDGRTVWKKEINDNGIYYSDSKPRTANSTPCAGNGAIYCVDTEGRLLAVDTADGEILWQRTPLPKYVEEMEEAIAKRENGNPFMGRPLAFMGGILLQMEDGALEAINPDDGSRIWKREKLVGPKGWIQYYATDSKTLVVTATHDGRVYALDIQSGDTEWELSGLGNNERGPIINEGFLLLNGDSTYALENNTVGRLFCYRLNGLDLPELLWEADCYHRSSVMPPVIYNGKAFLRPWRCKPCDDLGLPSCGYYPCAPKFAAKGRQSPYLAGVLK